MAKDKYLFFIENVGDDEYAIVIASTKEEAIKKAFPHINPKWPNVKKLHGVVINHGITRIIEAGYYNKPSIIIKENREFKDLPNDIKKFLIDNGTVKAMKILK